MNPVVKQAFEKTEGKHVQYIELSTGNHYAINEWNPVPAPHQVGRRIWFDLLLPALMQSQTGIQFSTTRLWSKLGEVID